MNKLIWQYTYKNVKTDYFECMIMAVAFNSVLIITLLMILNIYVFLTMKAKFKIYIINHLLNVF